MPHSRGFPAVGVGTPIHRAHVIQLFRLFRTTTLLGLRSFGLQLQPHPSGTRVDYDTQYGAQKFASYWASVAYRFPLGPVQLQPALRAERLDSNCGHANGIRRALTAAVATYVTNSTRVLVDLTRTDVEAESPYLDQPEPLPALPYRALSNTCATVQLQTAL